MSDGTRPTPRCVDCGTRWATLDDFGRCLTCFVARGLQTVAELQHGATDEPHREPVTGQRLAAIIATAAIYMPPSERLKLWLECCRLLGPTIDKETHPELYAVIRSLRDALPAEAQASQWN